MVFTGSFFSLFYPYIPDKGIADLRRQRMGMKVTVAQHENRRFSQENVNLSQVLPRENLMQDTDNTNTGGAKHQSGDCSRS